MFGILLISIVIAPVLFAVQAGKSRGRTRSLLLMLTTVLTYDLLYMVMLYYLHGRWVG